MLTFARIIYTTEWPNFLGSHGVGSVNDNGLRLLSLCAEHDFVITNILQQKNKYKTPAASSLQKLAHAGLRHHAPQGYEKHAPYTNYAGGGMLDGSSTRIMTKSKFEFAQGPNTDHHEER